MSPITEIMNAEDFSWTKEATSAFEIIKKRITSAPVLALPNSDKLFEVVMRANKELDFP